MRTYITIGIIVILLILGKIFFFKAPNKGNAAGGGSAPNAKAGGKDAKGGMPSPTIPANIFVVKPENVDNVVTASGTVVANEEVELKTEASGRLIQLNIQEGKFVQKGQLIAKLKDDDLKAQLKKLDYQEALAKQLEARQKKLLDINAISKEEYEITANNINTINADKELIKAQLEKTELRAPFSGKIGLKSISLGAYITPATIIATLTQTNPVKIDYTIPEKYASQIKVGNSVKFTIDGKNGDYTARIIAIDPKVDESLRTLKIRGLTANPSGLFIPGMYVKVNTDLSVTNSLMIPTESVIPILKGKKVYVLKNGIANEIMITTGLRTDKAVQVLTGLQAGDSLIVSSLMAMKKESKVKVKQVVN